MVTVLTFLPIVVGYRIDKTIALETRALTLKLFLLEVYEDSFSLEKVKWVVKMTTKLR